MKSKGWKALVALPENRDPIFQTPSEMCKEQEIYAELLCGFHFSVSMY